MVSSMCDGITDIIWKCQSQPHAWQKGQVCHAKHQSCVSLRLSGQAEVCPSMVQVLFVACCGKHFSTYLQIQSPVLPVMPWYFPSKSSYPYITVLGQIRHSPVQSWLLFESGGGRNAVSTGNLLSLVMLRQKSPFCTRPGGEWSRI